MSTTSNPVPLTPAVAATIVPPSSAPQLAAVVVQNASPYTLAVVIAGAQAVVQPYTADLFPTTGTGSPITILPSNPDNTTGVSANAQAIWYGPDEIPDTTAYPAALTPPPVAVGVAVAAQLLAGGIPNVLVEDTLWNANWSAAGTIPIQHVAGYASIAVQTGAPVASITVTAKWYLDAAGTILLGSETFIVPGGTSGFAAAALVTLAVRTPYLLLSAAGSSFPGSPPRLVLLGSNRPAPYIDTRNNTGNGDSWTQPTQALVAGTTYTLAQFDTSTHMLGLQYATFLVNLSAAVKGYFQLVTANVIFQMADTSEMHALGTATAQIVTKLIALPASAYTWQFVCTTGGAGTALSVTMVPASL